MKKTFYNLDLRKQEKILDASIQEFGHNGFSRGSTDRIIRTVGISKGGLYEYIHSKEELFLYAVEQTYNHLYDYIRQRIDDRKSDLSLDVLDRIEFVSSLAIDFYLDHPRYISLIVRTHELNDPDLAGRINDHFSAHFLDIFGDCDFSTVRVPKERLLELLVWLLIKTRYDFLKETEMELTPEQIRKDYMDNWRFFISTLKNGVYNP